MKNTIQAWHILEANEEFPRGVLRDETKPPNNGLWLKHEGQVEICESGLHASRRLIDALRYAPGNIICRVDCGDIVTEQDDKLVCRSRKILWRVDAEQVLHEFAIWCARQALARIEEPDPRSLKALEVKEAWLRGEATEEEFAAARAAASAAWAAARAAASDAARAARAAAWAASDAARAARAAAWAASDAAWAARAAAWAASDAEEQLQDNKLVEMVEGCDRL